MRRLATVFTTSRVLRGGKHLTLGFPEVTIAMRRAVDRREVKINAEVRRAKADTLRALRNALKRAFTKITTQDIRGWLKHADYAVP